MKLTWESGDWPGARLEPGITHLAWTPQGADRPGEGLLAAGSESGCVGITFTSLDPVVDDDKRYNFNLRGHHSQISLVVWNSVQCKLASCDLSGIIYVWARNDERWSVELVNDRGVKVRDLSWSPCGSSALICYEDNFVLIGSATGQRVWSNSFTSTVTCGVWAPDSRELVLGFRSGNLHVLSDQGATIRERSLCSEGIERLAFSPAESSTLAVLTADRRVLFLDTYDQVEPLVFQSEHSVLWMAWNSEGSLLALADSHGQVLLLDREARRVHTERVPVPGQIPLTAMCWAHDGRALIFAAGGHVAVGRLLPGVPSLFTLSTYDVWHLVGCDAAKVEKLPLPAREKSAVAALDHHIIRCRIPGSEKLCEFVCSVSEARCYCTIRPFARHSHSFVLCMEHLGGLVPLLLGRQVNRFLPQFHISLCPFPASTTTPPSLGSSAQVEDATPLVPLRASTARNSLWRRSKRHIRAFVNRHLGPRPPQSELRLVHVSSNVWCTKFNISSLAPSILPPFLAQVLYKTSVLHLQPRTFNIHLAELDGRWQPSSADGPSTTTANDEATLTREERIFFERVVSECAALRATIDTELRGETAVVSEGASSWQTEVDSLEFIDGADTRSLLATAPRDASSEMREVLLVLDELSRIAAQLKSFEAAFNSKSDAVSVATVRGEVKELLLRVRDIEERAGLGVLANVRSEILRRVERMKKELGESEKPAPPNVLVLHNKTPFWNEHNQVYQLDFGGRVTQESAKNFQIELDSKQVMQFGRIESGSYTLDFRRPFSAAQAFAVALASITQRLK